MKLRNLLLLMVLFVLPLTFSNKLFAQDEECCDDEEKYMVGYSDEDMWQKQFDDYRLKQLDLQNQLKVLNTDIDAMKSNLSSSDDHIMSKEKELYSLLGTDKAGMVDFRRKFEDTEKRINSRVGTPEDAHKMYFDYVEASKMKCLPEFWERYLEMKIKLMEWEKGKFVDYTGKEIAIGKDGQYTVVKGDCLSGIASKKTIYGNRQLWPKIYEANKNGVISAPSGVAKLIKNPNLIYPGQVLRIPALTESEKNQIINKTYKVKKIRKKKI